jgi:Ca2+/H+ antiporter
MSKVILLGVAAIIILALNIVLMFVFVTHYSLIRLGETTQKRLPDAEEPDPEHRSWWRWLAG